MSAVHYVKTANFIMPSLSLSLPGTWLHSLAELASRAQQERRRARLAFLLSLSIHAMALAAAVTLSTAPTIKPAAPRLELIWLAGESAKPTPEPPPAAPVEQHQVRARSTTEHHRRIERKHPQNAPTIQHSTPAGEAQAAATLPSTSVEASPAPAHALPHDSRTNSQPPVTEVARFNADYLHNPPPAYPPASRRRGEEGRVLLKVWVLPDGRPGNIQLHDSCGFERLDSAALDAVRRWQFVPARRGSEMVAGWVIVPIQFSLKEAG